MQVTGQVPLEYNLSDDECSQFSTEAKSNSPHKPKDNKWEHHEASSILLEMVIWLLHEGIAKIMSPDQEITN